MITKIEAINSEGKATEIDIQAYLKDKEVFPPDTTAILITEILKEINLWT